MFSALIMQQLLQAYLRRLKAMSLRPEIHFSSVFEHCALNNNFQCFQGNPLNRFNLHRKSLEDIVQHPQSRFLPFRQLKVLFNQEKKQPVWVTHQDLFQNNNEQTLSIDKCELVLLGIGSQHIIDRPSLLTNTERTKLDSKLLSKFLLASEPTPDEFIFFALSIPTTFGDNLPGTYTDLRPLLPQLSVVDAAVCGQGRALLDWHASSQFCGKCGSSTVSLEGGTRRKCSKCNNTLYPRTDPVAITLVIHPDKEHVLLGRKSIFPPSMYTCLAGFIEPGESIPEACAREVWEESGVVIDTNVTHYFDSQPWPFLGGQLMIGCLSYAIDETITLHDSELEDCRWFSRQEVGEMIQRGREINLAKDDQGLRIPPPIAIAHQLIYRWYSTIANI
jgi:NADH pyrophosphatase NudC (nudix superfamily)